MSFSSEWLALREPYDHKARSRSILSRAMRWPMTKAVDLGAGTGSTLRALTPHIPAGTRWTLVDNSSDLLNALPVEGERLELDLSRELPPFGPECLVTASAFFDLVSEAWIERLVPALDGAALYSALDVDGRHEIAPAHDDDSWVFDGFRAHQTGTDKGFGVALGPAAHNRLERALASAGYTVFSAPSDWLVREKEMSAALLGGIAEAAGAWHGDPGRAKRWLDERLAAVTLNVLVGHRDLFAIPP